MSRESIDLSQVSNEALRAELEKRRATKRELREAVAKARQENREQIQATPLILRDDSTLKRAERTAKINLLGLLDLMEDSTGPIATPEFLQQSHLVDFAAIITHAIKTTTLSDDSIFFNPHSKDSIHFDQYFYTGMHINLGVSKRFLDSFRNGQGRITLELSGGCCGGQDSDRISSYFYSYSIGTGKFFYTANPHRFLKEPQIPNPQVALEKLHTFAVNLGDITQ